MDLLLVLHGFTVPLPLVSIGSRLVQLLQQHLTQALQPSVLLVYLRVNDDWLEAIWRGTRSTSNHAFG